MPWYYFNIQDAGGSHRDEVGDEFADFEEAREQAQSLLPDITREELPDGELHKVVCEVRDEAGRVIYRGELTFQGTRLEISSEPLAPDRPRGLCPRASTVVGIGHHLALPPVEGIGPASGDRCIFSVSSGMLTS